MDCRGQGIDPDRRAALLRPPHGEGVRGADVRARTRTQAGSQSVTRIRGHTMKRRQQLSALGLVLALAGSHAGYLFAQGAPAALTVTSPAFNNGDALPKDYSADGKNVSPPLAWTGAPAATKEFALILDDPDANFGGRGPFVHWVIYKIPGTAKGLPEAVPMGANVTVAGIAGAINGLSG